jgi:hypothetical protein
MKAEDMDRQKIEQARDELAAMGPAGQMNNVGRAWALLQAALDEADAIPEPASYSFGGGKVRVDVYAPEFPDGTDVRLGVNIYPRDAENNAGVLEALGGSAAFAPLSDVDKSYASPHMVRDGDEKYGADVQVWFAATPSRPLVDPFIAELAEAVGTGA